ncbi:antibiotic biosynthesis monooxygenase [Leptolyngbya sp. FACHB-261]|uniref:antibiotic biosynthesis monooxygenase family protein n=1 Tax=Leptolyngbya sp. FACHB-261 TaxID=2692806 RepID=UPI00168438CE|nr:antibiotic biosynthesis monooxygenase [Leptolyngbya sp. FACHB-261]MBD2100659.1 antibiotic biosynthesis monooxygenase [Leptolyngbya sp. FACHB-261]
MLTVTKDNSISAEIDIFPTEPQQQQSLIDGLINYIQTVFKQQPGFVAAAIHRSRDGMRVVNYVQWASPSDYEAYVNNAEIPSLSNQLSTFPASNSRLYEILVSEPTNSKMQISTDIKGLINFGIFKLRNPKDQPRFLKATQEAVDLVAGQAGLVTTHFHRSLDGAMVVNYGLWSNHKDYVAMNENPPFAGPLLEMLRLADNEFQMSLYEVVFTETST